MALKLPRATENIESADWLHLSEGETVQWAGRPSLYTIALAVIGGVLLALLGIVLTLWLRPTAQASVLPGVIGFVPLLLTAVGLWVAVMTYLDWLRLLYVITDEQIYVKYGLLSRDVTQIRLDRVQNTSYTQSVIERFLGYGNVHVYTAGTSTEDVTFENVPNPNQIKYTLVGLLGKHEASGVKQVQRV